MIELKINVNDIPKDKIFVGEKGKYLDICVSKMQQPDRYNNTHTVYIKPKQGEDKIYIGKGVGKFEDAVSAPTPSNQSMSASESTGSGVDDLPF